MSKVLVIDSHNIAPHLETSFEIALRHLDDGDTVAYHFLGHAMPYREFMAYSRLEAEVFRRWMPERVAARLLRGRAFHAHWHDRLEPPPDVPADPMTLSELMHWTYDGADLGMGVASSLISLTGNSRFEPAASPGLVADAIRGTVAAYATSLKIIERERPDVVYLFNGRLCHTRAILRAAQASGVPVMVHDRGANQQRFAAYPFVPHDRERVQEEIRRRWEVREAQAETKAHQWFRERREGKPKDWWSFTDLQRKGALPPLPVDKRIVTYFSSSDDEMVAIGEVFRWTHWENQIAAVEDLMMVVGSQSDMQLVIRLHPHLLKKHPDERVRWRTLAQQDGGAILIEPEAQVDTYALVEASDVVVCGGSTVGMESVYWGTPSVLLGPSDYDLLGAVHVAEGRDHLLGLLRNESLTVDPASAVPYGYHRATFGDSFRYYEPATFTTGRLLGVDVQRLPHLPGLANQAKEKLLWPVRDSLRSLRTSTPA